MKKLILIIGLFMSICFAFAQTTISLESDKKSYDIEDVINVMVRLNIQGSQDVQIKDIKGLDKFDLVSRNQTRSYHSINGKVSAQTVLNYGVKAKTKGEYEIGPVIAQQGTGIITSNTIKIKVSGEKIMLGAVNPNTLSLADDQDVDDVDQIPEAITGDIHDIRAMMKNSFVNRWIVLIVVVLFAGGWIVYDKFFKIDSNVEVDMVEDAEKNDVDFVDELHKISSSFIDEEKDVFYSKLGALFRAYLAKVYGNSFYSLTLEEAKKNLPKNIFDIWQKIYYPEYDISKDTKKQRYSLIQEVLSVFETLDV